MTRFVRAEEGLAGAIEVQPLDIDIEVQPCSLIKLRTPALSPAAQTHDFIISMAEAG